MMEMCQYRTKCLQCRTLVKRVRSLLDEIADIKKNEALGVCEHCKHANPSGKCRRCEYIVNKFLCNKVKHYQDRQTRFKTWISKVNQLLQNVLEIENVCKHKLNKDSSVIELEKLLQELKPPLEMREPEITFFPAEAGSLRSITQSKEMLEELLVKLKSKSQRKSNDSLLVSPSVTSSCVCKYFMKDSSQVGGGPIEVLPVDSPELLDNKINVSKASGSSVSVKKDREVIKAPSRDKAKIKSPKLTGKENTPPGKVLREKFSQDKPQDEKTPKKGKTTKPKLSPEEEMMLKMMKDREKEKKQKEKTQKPEKLKQFAKIESLPELKVREIIKIAEEKSESVIECLHNDERINDMVKGTKVVPFNPHHKDIFSDRNVPLLFNIDTAFPENEPILTTVVTATVDKEITKPTKCIDEDKPMKGVLKYELSNREFIDKGFTVLPTTKIMRRMNIYKMEPANQKYDWFKRHQNRKIMFYESSEKLAVIEETGGKWFYRNGRVALDYYTSQDLNGSQRYVVYSSGDAMDDGRNSPITVLASFDFSGNGVVYDHYGNVRLKYNQSEGMIYDQKIAPTTGRWKWHSLNDPPILQQVFVDTHLKHRDLCLEQILKLQKEDKENISMKVKEQNPEMLAIEFDNFVREKADKLMQKFKPFQIRIKALKLNKQLSLRILDQSNIYLLFREGKVSLKLNLGMVLINSEIVDTITSDVADVATPYDRIPPKSQSLADIQHTLHMARRIGKVRDRNTFHD